MIEHYSKRDKHEYEPGDPRATSRQGFLMSKAGHWSTYHDGLLMKAQCCHHGNSSHFFIFFMEQEARSIPIPRQDMI